MKYVHYMFTVVETEDKLWAVEKVCVKNSDESWTGDSRGMFTFSRVVHEEALKQLVLDGCLLCRVIGQDVFMAHIIQTWREETNMLSHGDETEIKFNHFKWEVLCSLAMAKVVCVKDT